MWTTFSGVEINMKKPIQNKESGFRFTWFSLSSWDTRFDRPRDIFLIVEDSGEREYIQILLLKRTMERI